MSKIIGLHGFARSGKTTVASFIEERGYTSFAFADRMKATLLELDPYLDGRRTLSDIQGSYHDDRLDGREAQRLWETTMKILPLIAPAGTTVSRSKAKHLLTHALNPRISGTITLAQLVGEIGWEGAKDHRVYGHEVRHLLQLFGTELCQGVCGKRVWVDLLELEILDHFRDNPWGGVIVSDVRFDQEGEAVARWGGAIIDVRRDNVVGSAAHASEQGISQKYINTTIHNDSTLEHLRSITNEAITLVESSLVPLVA